jgi:GPH family glycoside/pentoside/hexuronide:cation symporter
MANKISKKELLSYGCLAAPLSFAGIAIYINAPDFYATEYGISLGTLGLTLLALRFIDGVQDPIIGYLSDKYYNLTKVIMLCALILLSVSFFFLFKPLSSSYILWFAIMVFLSTTAFSIVTINLNSIGGMWSKDKNQKTTIAGYRETFGILGLLTAITLPSILQNHMEKTDAFAIVSLVLIAMTAVTSLIFFPHVKKIVKSKREQTTFKLPSKINSRTKRFYIIYALSMLASSIPAVLVLFFIRDRLGMESYTGLFLLTYFISGAIGIPIWQYLSKLYTKERSWLISMLLAVLVFFWACFLNEGDFIQYLIICLLSGISFGADLVLPHSILADHINDDDNENYAKSYYGILNFLAKLCLALSSAIALPILEIQGFKPDAENSKTALITLSITYGAIPCFIKLFSIFLLWRMINAKKNSNYRSLNHAN